MTQRDSYEGRLKAELFETLRRYMSTLKEIESLESELSYEELCDDDGPYASLGMKQGILEEKIDELLLETKYHWISIEPIVEEMLAAFGREQAKDSVFEMELVDEGGLVTSQFSTAKLRDQRIERHLDSIVGEKREDMKRRLQQVQPLRLPADTVPGIKQLYREVIVCYVEGAFNASCVLCRAIVEQVAKRSIGSQGYGNLLHGKETSDKTVSIKEILIKKLSVEPSVISLYSKIGRQADCILHTPETRVDEPKSLEAIKWLQEFLEKFPKSC